MLVTGARLFELRERLASAGCDIPDEDSIAGREATRRWNGALNVRPALVARCFTALQVGEALRAARDAGLAVSVHNGGQDWTGRSLRDGSLVIDLSGMAGLSVDFGRREATIGGGVTVGQLNRAAGEHGLVAVIGNDGAVGMAGLVLGGGYGPLMTRLGLACDNLVSAEVVLPDGTIVTCDAERETDLFWALRGGGGSFGVVTSARVRLHSLDTVFAGNVVFAWPDAGAVLSHYAGLMLRAPAELFGAAVLSIGPGDQPVVVITLVWTGELQAGEAFVAEAAAAGNPMVVKAGPMPAAEILSLTDGKLVQGRGYEVATRWFHTLAPEAIKAMIAGFDERTSPLSSIIVHHCHGRATQVAREATAFGMREPHFTALVYATWEPARESPDDHRAWAKKLDATLAPAALQGGYANLLPDEATQQVACAFGSNGARLAAIKAHYDPERTLRGIPIPLSA